MTNEEAIKNLKKLRSFHNGSYATSIDKAIEALKEERPTGKWIKCIDILTDRDSFTCSWCGMPNTIDKPYCPNCGAKMSRVERR